MPTNLKRITFVVTPDIEASMDKAKKELFYNRSQSDMIRELVEAGLRTINLNQEKKLA